MSKSEQAVPRTPAPRTTSRRARAQSRSEVATSRRVRSAPGGRAPSAAPVPRRSNAPNRGGPPAPPVGPTPPARQVEVGSNFDPSQLQFVSGTSDRFTYTQSFCPVNLAVDGPPPPTAAPSTVVVPGSLEALEQQFASNIGLLFLDRTRIVPQQTVLGEELVSLSLAPGETVVLSQQSNSQNTVSFEQQDETDQEVTQQYASSLTTALEQGLNDQQQNSDKTQSGISGTLGFNYVVNVSASPSFGNSVSSADTATQQRSVKQTLAASQQVSSTYRAQHKTTFTISSQQTFQTTNQRTITNPNRFTPIDLRYFKIYLQMQLSLERYGVRLAWAPVVKDPGQAILAAAQAASTAVINAAVSAASLPTPPTPPTPPVDAPPRSAGAVAIFSPGVNLGQGVSADQKVTITNPDSQVYQWDGQPLTVSAVLGSTPQIPPSSVTQILSTLVDASGDLDVEIHAGYGTSVGSPSTLAVTVTANFIAIPTSADVAYQQAMAQYNQQLAGYNAQVAALQAAAAAGAQKDAKAAYDAVIANADPLATCITQVIGSDIPAGDYGSPAEIDVWRSIFDWSRATVELYPSWWSDAPINDPDYPAASFINASWARLYLPVLPGMEALALAAITEFTGQAFDSGSVATVLGDLSAYRAQYFGNADEVPTTSNGGPCPSVTDDFICLASWTELLPTDGTHLEVLQAATSADDDLTDQMLAIREALVAAETNAIAQLATNASNVQFNVLLRDEDGDAKRNGQLGG